MSSLLREVVLPAAASVGFLFAMAMPTAHGQPAAAAPGPAVVLASARPLASVPAEESGSDASVPPEATRQSTTARSEQRCVRVERIGKFTIRRWE